mgnify:CR=1 FL=1
MIENGLAPWLKLYVKAALGRKAVELVLLDVRNVTDVADVFMVCSGRSNRQVTAIAEFIEKELKKSGLKPLSAEGVKEGHWALLDYGHVVIHVFYDPVRRFYDIESLWADAGRIAVETIVEVEETNKDSEQQNG